MTINRKHLTVIEVWTVFWQFGSVPPPPIPVALRYDPATDPYAVQVIFRGPWDDGTDDEPAWSFARELLHQGLSEPAGLGDVRLWPWAAHGGFIALSFSSPDGSALFEVPRGVLERFLARSYNLVERGRESSFLDVDGALARLLEATP